jgi:IS5 family transposase
MSDLPPKPEKLSSTATEAEKHQRDALMKARKRCQDKANKKKRAIGLGIGNLCYGDRITST